MMMRFGPLVTSVVSALALVKLVTEVAINQTEAGASVVEPANFFPYHFQLQYWLKIDETCPSWNYDINP